MPFVIESGLAATTNKKYFRGRKNWVDWSNSKQGVIYCPADPFYVAIYLNHVIFISGPQGSIITAFYGIKWGHHVMGFNSPTDNSFLQLAFEGCQRLCETETTKREPMTSDMIKTLVTKYGGENSTISVLRFLLTCLVGIAGFLSIDELLCFKLKHIKIQESHSEIVIPKSKTDQHREGQVVYISRIKSEYCPVKYSEVYLQKAKLDVSNDKEGLLIRCIFKTKSGHKILKTNGVSYSRIREIFKGYLSEITTTPENFGLHSLRSGGALAAAAAAAANNGISDRLISKQGRWFSARNGYIKDIVVKRLTVSNTLGL